MRALDASSPYGTLNSPSVNRIQHYRTGLEDAGRYKSISQEDKEVWPEILGPVFQARCSLLVTGAACQQSTKGNMIQS